jgi:hypothetical protein
VRRRVVKPSQRIGELAEQKLADIEARTSQENFQRHLGAYRESALLRAVVQYLDDAHQALTTPTAEALADRTVNLNERLKKLEDEGSKP